MRQKKFDKKMRRSASRIRPKSIALPLYKDNPVPCMKAKCTQCCYGHGVQVLDEDLNEHLDTVVVGGGMRLLRHNKDGSCVHLDPKKGCTIYEHRPTACRTFDCRHVYFANIFDQRPDETKTLIAATKLLRIDPTGMAIERQRYRMGQVEISPYKEGPSKEAMTGVQRSDQNTGPGSASTPLPIET